MQKQFSKFLYRSYRDAKILEMANQNWPKIAKIATISNNEFIIAIKYFRMMEAASTFALPNQFLVEMSKKVFA